MNTGQPDYPFDLGAYRPAFLKTNDLAGQWFARGLAWLYGFNQEEAVRCFRAAAAADDGLALAWWGVAISSGPFMNLPWDWLSPAEKADMLAACHAAVGQAGELAGTASPPARALINALAIRFPQAEVPDDEMMASWERAYADEMAVVYAEFGDDPDIAALFVDSQIMLTPWQIYDVDARAPNPAARVAEIHAALDRGLAGAGADHIGLLHYDIHVNEMSPTPERALESARRLEALAPPDAGHLQHMPSHIYALLGDFGSAARCSRLAMDTDRRFMPDLHRTPFYRTLVCHDAHMLMFTGMQTGNLADAQHGAAVMAAVLEDRLTRPPETHMEMTLEGYCATIAHVDVRFGRWQQIADRGFDGDASCRPVSWAMHCQARAVALAALGRHDEAGDAAAAFDAARKAVPDGYGYFNNQADDILAVGAAMMRGEMAYHAGETEAGLAWLWRAVEAEDRLAYTEPRAWMHPPRHALGALLLEQGQLAAPRRLYECDLGHSDDLPVSRQNRGNIGALHGLAECLRRLGDPQAEDAAAALAAAMPLADQAITSSCFCRGRYL
ncbi:MAG: hypothetical protein VXW17_01115 [Pseudomonadota bacterium]|nr:hypothetical protein [Pseudomonadota bacterium]